MSLPKIQRTPNGEGVGWAFRRPVTFERWFDRWGVLTMWQVRVLLWTVTWLPGEPANKTPARW